MSAREFCSHCKIQASSRTSRSRIHPNGPELALEENQNPVPSEQSRCITLFTCLLIASFWLDAVWGWHTCAKFESGAVRFFGWKSYGAGAVRKISFHPCPSIQRHSKQQTRNIQNRSKYHFWGERATVHVANICWYIATEEATGESNTFLIKLQTVTQTHAGSLWF